MSHKLFILATHCMVVAVLVGVVCFGDVRSLGAAAAHPVSVDPAIREQPFPCGAGLPMEAGGVGVAGVIVKRASKIADFTLPIGRHLKLTCHALALRAPGCSLALGRGGHGVLIFIVGNATILAAAILPDLTDVALYRTVTGS